MAKSECLGSCKTLPFCLARGGSILAGRLTLSLLALVIPLILAYPGQEVGGAYIMTLQANLAGRGRVVWCGELGSLGVGRGGGVDDPGSPAGPSP